MYVYACNYKYIINKSISIYIAPERKPLSRVRSPSAKRPMTT